MQIMNASKLYCGLDIHRNGMSFAAVVNQMGKLVRSKEVPDGSLQDFLERYHPTKIAMEASTAITPIYRELTKQGYDVFVSHPTKTRLIAESRIKTDRVDARALAELLRLDALPSSYMPDEEISSLREMVRRRAYLVRERTKFRVKIRDCLVYNGIKRTKDEGSSNGLFTIDGINWLRSLNLEPVDMYLGLVKALDREISALSAELKEKASGDEDVKLLETIPGIGYYSALLIKSEIGEINRFPSGEKLCSYAGLVPSIRSSGFHARYGSITKQGLQMASVDHGRSCRIPFHKEQHVDFEILSFSSSEERKADSCGSCCEKASPLLLFSSEEQEAVLRSGINRIASSSATVCVFP